jgi:spore maturation protein CgeB
LERVNPKPGKINILWIISTPELITKGELDGFDIIFVASNSWSEWVTKKTGIKVLPLLQCTDPKRFNPSASKPDLTKEIIFVGNARKRLRQIVKDLIDAQISIKIYGKGWAGRVPQSLIGQKFIPNDELPLRYRSSKIVLNDHRPDMRKRGFYSNRLFDAVASGARVLSDDVDGLEQFFEGAVKAYADSSELQGICADENLGSWGTDDQIRDRAIAFGKLHSFESRAQEMIQAVRQLQKP